MASTTTSPDAKSRIRDTALKHALSIEEKKAMRAKVADLVIEAFDLPSNSGADPAKPSSVDINSFKNCLTFFQTSDFDDLIQERNIDERCGYALCPKPRRKVIGGGEKVWNQKSGKNFQLLSKAEIEKWCSKDCENRAIFVRSQLSTEPAWIRQNHNDVKFLDEIKSRNQLASAIQDLSINDDKEDDMTDKLQELSLERGESDVRDVSDRVSIVENMNNGISRPPRLDGNNKIEGHQPRKVRFAESMPGNS